MNKKQSVLLQRTYIILVFCFMYLPIAVMIAFSFNESKSRSNFTGFTLGWYKSLFHNEMILSALGLSLVLALVSSVVATVLGTLATIGINCDVPQKPAHHQQHQLCACRQPRDHYRRFADAALRHGAATFGIGGESGIFGWFTLLIAHITFNIPYVIFNVRPQAAPAGPQPVQRSDGPGLHTAAGLLQGHHAAAVPGHPVCIPNLPDLLH